MTSTQGRLRAAHTRAMEQVHRHIYLRRDAYLARYWLDVARSFRRLQGL